MQHSKSTLDFRKLATILVSVILGVSVVCFAVLLIVLNLPEPQGTATAAATTVAPTAPSSAAPATAAAQTTAPPAATQATDASATAQSAPTAASEGSTQPTAAVPDALAEILGNSGYTGETLEALGCSQLVVVSASGSSAQISYYEMTDGAWAEDSALRTSGYVGSSGAVTEMSENISGTPIGLYGIGSAFYQYDAPETGLDAFEITADTYWVDDPDSAYYNRRVVGTENRDWNSAEEMASISGYKYGFVINYNMPAVYNKGSAIFFHIGSNPTLGCIATSEDMVLAYLAKLSAAANPQILIE